MNDKRLRQSRAILPMIGLGLVTNLGGATAMSAEPDEESAAPLKYSLTPFAGYRFGGRFAVTDTDSRASAADRFSYGIALDAATDEQTQYELFYSRQSTRLGAPAPAPADTVIEYLHLGGTVFLGDSRRFQPYIIGTLGATRFSADTAVGRDKIDFSISLGGGLRIPFNNHLALRLEARGFATFFNTNGTVFCRSDQSGGVCQIRADGSAFFQGEALAGLAYTF